MQNILLALIAGLLIVLVACVKKDEPATMNNKGQAVLMSLTVYLFPLLVALVFGAIFFGVSYWINSATQASPKGLTVQQAEAAGYVPNPNGLTAQQLINMGYKLEAIPPTTK